MLHFKYCMKKIALLFFTGILAVASLGIQSCVKKGNDVPEDQTGFDPKLQVTHTIAQLLAMPAFSTITEDVIVSGIVVMDDRSGNYYKKFVIQDETGGIEINLDQNNIYNDYPVGRKVYLKCKGLTLANNGGTPQIGYGVDERTQIVSIPFVMADEFIVKGNFPNEIPVDTFDFDELYVVDNNAANLNKLVAIRNVEFAEGGSGTPYAAANATTNRILRGCGASNQGGNLVVRTSNYARFQGQSLPGGNGVILGLYTKYNNTAQIILRDTSDVRLGGPGCNSNVPQTTIADLRAMFTGSPLPLADLKVSGVVISDRQNGNAQTRNLVIQQGDKGIMIRFSANHSFNLGDSIDVILNGASLEEYNGLLQVNNTQLANASKKGTGTIMAQSITLNDLNANFEAYESILVKISSVTFPSGTYSGNQTISDASGGTIILYTSSSASFASQPMPATASSLTGIVGQFGSTLQLQIRNLSDVQ